MTKRTIRARLRHAAFEALYHQFAWAYDWVSRTFFRDQWRRWQLAALPHLRGRRVLELGPGTGRLLARLAIDGYYVVGLELSPAMLGQSVRRLRRLTVVQRSRVALLRGSGLTIPLRSGSMDSILATFPSDYISAPATLREVERVLAAGGRLVLVPGGLLLPSNAPARLLNQVGGVVYGDQSPSASFSRKLAAQLTALGFSVRHEQWRNTQGVAFILVAEKQWIAPCLAGTMEKSSAG